MTLSQDSPRTAKLYSLAKPTSVVTAEVDVLGRDALKPNPVPVLLLNSDAIIKPQVSLATLTSFRVGGPAEWYVAPRSLGLLQESLQWAASQGLPVTFLGAGSNLLVSDRGLSGLIICTRHLRHTHFEPETGRVTASAGEPLTRLAWQAAERGWQGLEWAVGIPGTLGGAVVMNAGAHGDCTADFLVNAQVLSYKQAPEQAPEQTITVLTPDDLGYAYRTSNLQNTQRLVTQATLQLQPGADPVAVTAATAAHLEQRRTTQPYHLPSCGSVFRNPKPYTAGWLIEQTGLKGHQIGGAQVSHLHANFILNRGGATASDILRLIRYIQQQVEARWAIHLEPEVKLLGEFAPD